jgi:hypothetical protein
MSTQISLSAAPPTLGRRLRWLLVGDWHPLLRDPLDLARLTFAGAAAAFLASGRHEYAIRFTIAFLVLAVAQRLRLPRRFDVLFIAAMVLQAWGNALRLFEDIYWWDDLVHLVFPMATVPVLYILLLRLGMVNALTAEPHRRHRWAFALFAIGMGLSIGALYEVYEYLMVQHLQADIAIGYADTIDDLALDTAGSMLGGALLVLSSTLHWGATRSSGLHWHEPESAA